MTTINNSYDSESLSTSVSSSSDIVVEKSFGEQICSLPELLNINNKNVYSSQESDFIGFDMSNNDNQTYNTTPFSMYNNQHENLKLTKIECNDTISLHSFSNDSMIISDQNVDNKKNRILKEIVELKNNFCENTIKTTFTQIINKLQYSSENSCNAVDNYLSNNINNNIQVVTKDLSFNGKIDKILNKEEQEKPKNINLLNNELIKIDENPENQIEIEKNNINLNISLELLENDTSCMKYTNEKSPDLFADEELDDNDTDNKETDTPFTVDKSTIDSTNDNVIVKNEKILMNRLQMSLTGVLPPPSVTISQLNIDRMLQLYKENEDDYFNNQNNDIDTKKTFEKCETLDSLFIPQHSVEEAKNMPWPEVMKAQAHGICLNRTSYTEKIESLCLKYVERNIGAETSSSFTFGSPSSAKKRLIRLKNLTQSPGSRLSHLARRRAMFSSANLLLNAGQSKTTNTTNFSRVVERQILLDPIKTDKGNKRVKTPKRKTPGKKRTPSSSNKIKENIFDIMKQTAGPSRETSKRALFQSPPKPRINRIPSFTPEVALRVQKSKRVLFSPAKFSRCSSFTTFNERNDNIMTMRYNSLTAISEMDKQENLANSYKRKYSQMDNENYVMNELDSSTENLANCSKFARSQSLCVTADISNTQENYNRKSLIRTTSEVVMPSSIKTHLTDSHKKKLLWAVSQALQTKQITFKHINFKQYVSVLARVSKRLYLEYEEEKMGSTSEKMLRLTNKLVYSVIQGKTIDEIYLCEKQKMDLIKKNIKLSGYITAEDYKLRRNKDETKITATTTSSENIIDINLPQLGENTDYVNQLSQTYNCNNLARNMKNNNLSSTSKNNENSTVLRENVDNEQRQKLSAQKNLNFSGKNQITKITTTSLQKQNKLVGAKNANIAKAKRQISF